jgi:hypothetical protein
MRYRLRTLLIVLALGPPLLAGAWMVWNHQAAITRQKRLERLKAELAELESRLNARAVRIKQLSQEIVETKFNIFMLERNRSDRPTDQMQAEPGIYFLGPEVLTPTKLQ